MSAAVHELVTASNAVRDLIQDIAATAAVCLGLSTVCDRIFYGRWAVMPSNSSCKLCPVRILPVCQHDLPVPTPQSCRPQ